MINLIWAQSLDGVIGNKGKVPWDLPEDLKHFKNMTEYQSVVMGRRTWDSLPKAPLINRRNIVLSESVTDIHGVTVYDSVEKVVNAEYGELWVIGGAEIYREFMPYADALYITMVYADVEGDTFAPDVRLDEWVLVSTGARMKSVSGLYFEIRLYERPD